MNKFYYSYVHFIKSSAYYYSVSTIIWRETPSLILQAPYSHSENSTAQGVTDPPANIV